MSDAPAAPARFYERADNLSRVEMAFAIVAALGAVGEAGGALASAPMTRGTRNAVMAAIRGAKDDETVLDALINKGGEGLVLALAIALDIKSGGNSLSGVLRHNVDCYGEDIADSDNTDANGDSIPDGATGANSVSGETDSDTGESVDFTGDSGAWIPTPNVTTDCVVDSGDSAFERINNGVADAMQAASATLAKFERYVVQTDEYRIRSTQESHPQIVADFISRYLPEVAGELSELAAGGHMTKFRKSIRAHSDALFLSVVAAVQDVADIVGSTDVATPGPAALCQAEVVQKNQDQQIQFFLDLLDPGMKTRWVQEFGESAYSEVYKRLNRFVDSHGESGLVDHKEVVLKGIHRVFENAGVVEEYYRILTDLRIGHVYDGYCDSSSVRAICLLDHKLMDEKKSAAKKKVTKLSKTHVDIDWDTFKSTPHSLGCPEADTFSEMIAALETAIDNAGTHEEMENASQMLKNSTKALKAFVRSLEAKELFIRTIKARKKYLIKPKFIVKGTGSICEAPEPKDAIVRKLNGPLVDWALGGRSTIDMVTSLQGPSLIEYFSDAEFGTSDRPFWKIENQRVKVEGRREGIQYDTVAFLHEQLGMIPTKGTNVWDSSSSGWNFLKEVFGTRINLQGYSQSLTTAIVPNGYIGPVKAVVREVYTTDWNGNKIPAGLDGSGQIHPDHPLIKSLDDSLGAPVGAVQFRSLARANDAWAHVTDVGLFAKGILVVTPEAVDDEGNPTIVFHYANFKGVAKKAVKAAWKAGVEFTVPNAHVGVFNTWHKQRKLKWGFQQFQWIRRNKTTEEIVASIVDESLANSIGKDLEKVKRSLLEEDEQYRIATAVIEKWEGEGNILDIPSVVRKINEKAARRLYHIGQGAGLNSVQLVTVIDQGLEPGTVVTGDKGFKPGDDIIAIRFPTIAPQGVAKLKVVKPSSRHYRDNDGPSEYAIFMNPKDLTDKMQGDDDGDIIGITKDPRALKLFEHKISFIGKDLQNISGYDTFEKPEEEILAVEPEKEESTDLMGDSDLAVMERTWMDMRGPVGVDALAQAKLMAFGAKGLVYALPLAFPYSEHVDSAKGAMKYSKFEKAIDYSAWVRNKDGYLTFPLRDAEASQEYDISRIHGYVKNSMEALGNISGENSIPWRNKAKRIEPSKFETVEDFPNLVSFCWNYASTKFQGEYWGVENDSIYTLQKRKRERSAKYESLISDLTGIEIPRSLPTMREAIALEIKIGAKAYSMAVASAMASMDKDTADKILQEASETYRTALLNANVEEMATYWYVCLTMQQLKGSTRSVWFGGFSEAMDMLLHATKLQIKMGIANTQDCDWIHREAVSGKSWLEVILASIEKRGNSPESVAEAVFAARKHGEDIQKDGVRMELHECEHCRKAIESSYVVSVRDNPEVESLIDDMKGVIGIWNRGAYTKRVSSRHSISQSNEAVRDFFGSICGKRREVQKALDVSLAKVAHISMVTKGMARFASAKKSFDILSIALTLGGVDEKTQPILAKISKHGILDKIADMGKGLAIALEKDELVLDGLVSFLQQLNGMLKQAATQLKSAESMGYDIDQAVEMSTDSCDIDWNFREEYIKLNAKQSPSSQPGLSPELLNLVKMGVITMDQAKAAMVSQESRTEPEPLLPGETTLAKKAGIQITPGKNYQIYFGGNENWNWIRGRKKSTDAALRMAMEFVQKFTREMIQEGATYEPITTVADNGWLGAKWVVEHANHFHIQQAHEKAMKYIPAHESEALDKDAYAIESHMAKNPEKFSVTSRSNKNSLKGTQENILDAADSADIIILIWSEQNIKRMSSGKLVDVTPDQMPKNKQVILVDPILGKVTTRDGKLIYSANCLLASKGSVKGLDGEKVTFVTSIGREAVADLKKSYGKFFARDNDNVDGATHIIVIANNEEDRIDAQKLSALGKKVLLIDTKAGGAGWL